MNASSNLILVCDHRGAGLSARVEALATAGVRLEVCPHLRATLAGLERSSPALVLIDPLGAGGSAELEAVDELLRGDAPTPVLVVADPENPLPALLAGRVFELWDVVHRDAPVEEYLTRMDALRRLARRLGEVDELRYRAAHDDRTDLLRPTAFQARLTEHFSAAQRHRLELALVLMDLDRFGRINKTHDHTVGDRVITAVGRSIRGTLRAEDVAGRLGGDEFGVLLPYTNRVDAARVVGRLRDAVRELSGHIEGAPSDLEVSASIGFETYDGLDLDTLETLRAHAELALRRAKSDGGDRGIYYRSLSARGL